MQPRRSFCSGVPRSPLMNARIPSLLLAASLTLTACHSTRKTAGTTPRTPADWAGTYRGTLPCADCPGVVTTITLRPDGSFARRSAYIDRNGPAYVATGTASWDGTGGTLVLKEPGDAMAMRYIADAATLTQLDGKGARIAGPNAALFVLHKVAPTDIRERYWKLVELAGGPVPPGEGKEAYAIFHDDRGRISGNGGCNGFSGTYELKGKIGLAVSRIISTRMACLDAGKMATENGFLRSLEQADEYLVTGDTLTLKNGTTVLARLVQVEGR